MQAFPAWTPPGGALGQILTETRERVDRLMERRGALEIALREVRPGRSMASSLRRPDVGVVAELKRRSPSRGEINPALSPADRARAYARGGAAALSILTEPRHFGGSVQDLVTAREVVGLPVLKKDFHIDPIQLLEARVLGASAVLLIARSIEPRTLVALAGEAESLGLEPLIEVRSEAELECALTTTAPIIGVNSRDLESLEVDPSVARRLVPLIPAERVAVAESGIEDRAGVESAAAAGADAVLVGSAISAAADPEAAVRRLTGVRRCVRAA